ncbi:hypothetical protein BDV38DRAFT_269063 [Aspergillus pseudotamarii]|uniref:Arrestin-like N-terminal domain-containing protein n=1 Tax=Aspergillus pseudotamarii TaxID=132259 RepID=A0A5N6T2F5_ASPPS|nr:uncharacterized protein BDV38DRAFT_269063 [Aspergillus pseudotamarii]KAE8140485.1 hypothetical protein BDV38DRAFT_269063 [Aspergillus pseudotamarii]
MDTMTPQSRLHRALNLLKYISKPSPIVTIELDKNTYGLENAYTTFDRIQGTVIITVDSETPLENISITFEGTAKVSIGRETCTLSNTEATQTFLQLKQPVTRGIDSVPKILQPGCSYKLPFTFVVPQYLPCQSCNHNISCSDLKQAHLQLPPTLDDPKLGHGKRPTLDYVSSGKCHISYRVRVVLSKGSIPGTTRRTRLVDCAKSVRVLPISMHAPHPGLPIVSSDTYTQMEQSLSQGFAQPGLGELITEASHIPPISLHYPIDKDGAHTAVRLNLRFNPTIDAAPPQLKKASAKFQISTFYSPVPWEDYPSWTDRGLVNGWDRGAFTDTFPIMAFSMGSVQWVKHQDMGDEHRIQGHDGESLSDHTAPRNGSRSYYTASIVLPIVLPPRMTSIPTFHSCLISRTYNINLRLSFHTPKPALQTASTTIKVPLMLQYVSNNHHTSLVHEESDASDSTVMNVLPPPEYTATA